MAKQARWSEVYERLRRSILTLDLESGVQLSESQLASEFGVSPTPVRDALGRLSQEKLVTSRPGRGYWVAPLEIRDLQQLAEFRFILERGLAELLLHAPRDWTQAQELSANMRAPGMSPDSIVDANIDFHLALARIAGNDQLTNALRRVLEDSARFFRLGAMHSSSYDMADEHDELIRVLQKGDLEEVTRIYHSEAFGTRDRVLHILLESPSASPAVMMNLSTHSGGSGAKL